MKKSKLYTEPFLPASESLDIIIKIIVINDQAYRG